MNKLPSTVLLGTCSYYVAIADDEQTVVFNAERKVSGQFTEIRFTRSCIGGSEMWHVACTSAAPGRVVPASHVHQAYELVRGAGFNTPPFTEEKILWPIKHNCPHTCVVFYQRPNRQVVMRCKHCGSEGTEFTRLVPIDEQIFKVIGGVVEVGLPAFVLKIEESCDQLYGHPGVCGICRDNSFDGPCPGHNSTTT